MQNFKTRCLSSAPGLPVLLQSSFDPNDLASLQQNLLPAQGRAVISRPGLAKSALLSKEPFNFPRDPGITVGIVLVDEIDAQPPEEAPYPLVLVRHLGSGRHWIY